MTPHWFPAPQIPELKAFHDFHKLGEGSFGEVYEALQGPAPQAREVVVKRLFPVYAQRDEPKFRKTFLNEAKILKTLHHPGIPEYVDGYFSDKECFFIMERKRGLNLERLLETLRWDGKRLSLPLSLHLIDELLKVLSYLHSSQERDHLLPVVHCDIKPANVLVDDRLEVSLIDFAMAAPLEESLQRFPGGTKSYVAPEFFLDQPPSPASDLYSLTVLFHDLLLMKRVITNAVNEYDLFMKLLTREYLKNIEKENLSEPLKRLLLKGLAYLPADRFGNAEDYRKALADCARELDIPFKDRAILAEEWKRLQRRSG